MKSSIIAKGTAITVISKKDEDDYISLTDIAKYKNKDDTFIVINNWMRLRDTIEFLGLWESFSNPDFKPIEFDRFRQESGYNAFTLSQMGLWICIFLDRSQAITLLPYHPKNGLKRQTRLELDQSPADTVEPLLIKI